MNKWKRIRWYCIIMITLVITSCSFTVNAKEEITATEVTKDIQIGWNLGNQLDCAGVRVENVDVAYYERLHGTPPLNFELIDMVQDAGYQAIRIPVTYYCHMDENFQIDKEWLEYIEMVVAYVVGKDMYCIIDMHHDTGKTGWLRADYQNIEAQKMAVRWVWTQIATQLKDYNNLLIYEGFNEVLNNQNQWSHAGNESYEAMNILNQTFVDTVRACGGYNETRCLIVNTYAASAEKGVMDSFVLPTDTVEDRLIVGIHNYQTTGIAKMFRNINDVFISRGIPVILGEFGIPNSNSMSERYSYVMEVVLNAKQYGIPCLWWDDSQTCENSYSVKNYALINRKTMTWYFKNLADYMVSLAKSGI